MPFTATFSTYARSLPRLAQTLYLKTAPLRSATATVTTEALKQLAQQEAEDTLRSLLGAPRPLTPVGRTTTALLQAVRTRLVAQQRSSSVSAGSVHVMVCVVGQCKSTHTVLRCQGVDCGRVRELALPILTCAKKLIRSLRQTSLMGAGRSIRMVGPCFNGRYVLP